MNRGRPIAGAFLAACLAVACSSTVTLKGPSAKSGAAPSGDPAESAPVTAEGTPPADPNGTAPPVTTGSAPLLPSAATPTVAPANPAVAGPDVSVGPVPPLPAPAGPAMRTPTASRPKPPVTFRDRLASGLHTGTVGAAFGGLGGPIGLAAGGGGGFLAGFVAGRPIFGGSAPDDRQSWDQQVDAQQDWESQIIDHVQALDGGLPPPAAGISTALPPAAGDVADLPPPAGVGITGPHAGPVAPTPADPLADYEAWSQQILTHAQPTATRDRSPEETVAATPSPGAGEPSAEGADGAEALPDLASSGERRIRALDADDDGRPDAWFEYEGDVLRTHAMDRNGDGRRDREDLYEEGTVRARLLDEDWDGRFERRDTIRGGRVTARMIDRDGDGRYETLSLVGSPEAPGAAGGVLAEEAL